MTIEALTAARTRRQATHHAMSTDAKPTSQQISNALGTHDAMDP
jgi:hypothetical protein